MTKEISTRLSRLENRFKPPEEDQSARELMERLAWAKWRKARLNGSTEPAPPVKRPLTAKARAHANAMQIVEILNSARTRHKGLQKASPDEIASVISEE